MLGKIYFDYEESSGNKVAIICLVTSVVETKFPDGKHQFLINLTPIPETNTTKHSLVLEKDSEGKITNLYRKTYQSRIDSTNLVYPLSEDPLLEYPFFKGKSSTGLFEIKSE